MALSVKQYESQHFSSFSSSCLGEAAQMRQEGGAIRTNVVGEGKIAEQ